MRGGATAAVAVLLALMGTGGAQAQGAPPDVAQPATPPVVPPVQIQAETPTTTTAPVAAGPTALLTVDQDALYTESRWGKRALAELAARRRDVLAENDRIAAELEAEDDALTALRPTLPDDEFKRRADAFDARVQQVRQEREQAGNALIQAADSDRTAFLNAALPVFTAVMRERGASVILDRRTVFLASDAVDATEMLIARIDAQLGAGTALPPPDDPGSTTPPDAPAPPGPAPPAEPQP